MTKFLASPKNRFKCDESTIDEITKGDFKWNPIESTWLAKIIEGFPLTETRRRYCNNPLPVHSSFLKALMAPVSKQLVLENHAVSRVDIIRYLNSIDTYSMTTTICDGVATPKEAPILLSELSNISKERLDFFDRLFINIESEDHPFWIILSRTNKEWTAYVPENKTIYSPKQADKVAKCLQSIKLKVDSNSVNYEQNLQLNNLGDSDLVNQWHMVLLARIYPWLKLKVKNSLALYRSRVPLSLLTQCVWENCLRHFDREINSIISKNNMDNALRSAFVNRAPLSNSSHIQLMLPQTKAEYLFGDESTIKIYNDRMLLSFDENKFIITEDLKTLTISSKSVENSDLTEALYIIYHNPISRLSFAELQNYSRIVSGDELVKKMFTYDTHLQSIRPILSLNEKLSATPANNFRYPLHCAARNRFLCALNPNHLQDTEKSFEKRKELWRDAGRKMLNFYQKHGRLLDLDFINKATEINESWRDTFCDHEYPHRDMNANMWPFIQIAQMGSDGLDALFDILKLQYADKWDKLDKEPAPNFALTLDLSGGLTYTPAEYTKLLVEKIDKFSLDCYPLFSSLNLILPKSIDQAFHGTV